MTLRMKLIHKFYMPRRSKATINLARPYVEGVC